MRCVEPMTKAEQRGQDWGSWNQAEAWRKEGFASRSHAQRLQWLKSALKLAYQSGALPRATAHDDTLIEWFLSLDPTQRLAELESRIAFFNSVSPDGDPELSADSGSPRPAQR